MFTRTRLLVPVILFLAGTSGWLGYLVFAIPASGRNSVVTPGGQTIPCTYDVYIDGSNYMGRNCKTGDNDFKETTLQAILADVTVNNAHTYFEPGTYSLTAAATTFSNLVNIEWLGIEGATIFQQANSVNVASAMIRFTGTSTSDITIQGITFDFNRANNPGSPTYTCPNAGWTLQIDPDTGQPVPGASSNNIRLINNDFKNDACQSIEWIATDGIISGNYFTGNHEAMFLTGVQTQRLSVTQNIILAATDSTGNNIGGIDLEDRAQNITITANQIHGQGFGNGIAWEPANYTTVTGNVIEGFQVGVLVSGPGAIGAVENTVTANTIMNNLWDGVKINHSSEHGTIIANNNLVNNGGGSTDQTQILVSSSGPDIIISGNVMNDSRAGAARTQYGVYVSSTNRVAVISNEIVGYRSWGIRVENSNYATVMGNIVTSASVGALLVTGTSNFGIFRDNNFLNAGAPAINNQGSNLYKDNAGYNPIGKLTNFISTTGGTFIGVCGSTGTVVSTTVYVICGTDLPSWGCSGGTVTAIAEQDNLGNQIFSVANCAALPVNNPAPVGYKIVFTFSVAPTFAIYAN